ncbi:MAG: hypothetical protein ACI9R3_005886 [Verrucomicrobiales bacterium]|jgi:hypothetical protein
MQLKKTFLSIIIAAFAHGIAIAEERKEAPAVTPTLTWLSDMDEALAASKKSGKPILLEFR